MQRHKIFIVGYFGYRTNQLDGQTIKTRNIYQLIKQHISDDDCLKYFDTQTFQFSKLSIFTMFVNLFWCNKLVLIPAQNNLRFLFPIIYVLSFIWRYKIIHIAVGGWLDKFCFEHNFLCKLLKNESVILLENNNVIEKLKFEYNFNNVAYLHNYRNISYIPTISSRIDAEPLKIVFMARINKMKGLDIVFSIANHYSMCKERPIIIDFYGPIAADDFNYFEKNLAKYDFVQYYGTLQPDTINTTLNQYDLMILPTRYYTEGFPGSILDAYISGIPVLVSNWKHAHEFVRNGVDGYICNVDRIDEFVAKIDLLRTDYKLLAQMKYNAFESSKGYSAEEAWNILTKHL